MATTTNYGWDTPDDTDLVKDGAAAIRTLGSSVDTTTKNLNPQTTTGALAYRSATANVNTALPIGTAGQILAVSAGVPAWINNDQGDITEVQAGVGISIASGTGPIPIITNSSTDLITTAGDLLYGSAADTMVRLGIGSTGNVLTVASGIPSWAAPAAGGTTVKVVYGDTTTATTVASTTYADTGLSATITPTSASSKILVLVSQYAWAYRETSTDVGASIRLLRSSTTIYDPGSAYMNYQNGASSTQVQGQMMTIMYLDSPSTTSATTYKTQGAAAESTNNGQVQFQRSSTRSSIILMEIGA
jgi:hypothetical protein